MPYSVKGAAEGLVQDDTDATLIPRESCTAVLQVGWQAQLRGDKPIGVVAGLGIVASAY